MDINLPLILVCLSFAGIVIWLFDLFFLKPKRVVGQEESMIVREAKSFLPVILLVLVVRSFIAEPFQIPSSSMEPTLDIGDFILVNKFTYGIRLPVLGTKIIDIGEPKRGDVMVFFPPNDSRYFIKRVIGLPGDVIEYHDKQLTINGEKQVLDPIKNATLDYDQRDLFIENLNGVKHSTYHQPLRLATDYKTIVEPGHYFMMGDNRDNSSDSRVWGQVPEDRIVGRAFAIWMHWKDWSSLPSFSRVGKIQ